METETLTATKTTTTTTPLAAPVKTAAPQDLQILPVTTSKQMKDFLKLPWKLHSNDPVWTPPLLVAVKQNLDTKKNPFYKHAKLQLWVAYEKGEPVGRIAGIIDDNHNNFHEEKTGFWGFFECIDNQTVANALFKNVEGWAKYYGMKTLRGPVSPSTNHECGLQISAFDTTPYIMMTQNPEYYVGLVEKAGHLKAKDLFAWHIHHTAGVDERIIKVAQKLEAQAGITIRTANMNDFDNEITKILEIYNDAWEKNWGFVPMTPEEFRMMAKEMKPILIPEMLFIAEVQGEIAAFSLFLPDINQVLSKIRNGKLLPTGLLKLLWFTKVRKKFFTRGRVLTLGVKKKYRATGIAQALYLKYIKDGPKLGFPEAECSWILEDNRPMNEGLKLINAKQYKTYRIYDKAL